MHRIIATKEKEEQVKRLNCKIAELSAKEKVEFADIGSELLLKNGKLDESLFFDGLRPN